MIIKSLLLVFSLFLVGCAAPQYAIVSGQYGWDKRDTGGSQYSSDTMYKINTETGETWKMSYPKG